MFHSKASSYWGTSHIGNRLTGPNLTGVSRIGSLERPPQSAQGGDGNVSPISSSLAARHTIDIKSLYPRSHRFWSALVFLGQLRHALVEPLSPDPEISPQAETPFLFGAACCLVSLLFPSRNTWHALYRNMSLYRRVSKWRIKTPKLWQLQWRKWCSQGSNV